jgi:DNA-binding NarL/FixJ family response regulator
MTMRDIGERLCLSTKSVETHRLHVREKLRLKTRPVLIKYAVRWAGTRELILERLSIWRRFFQQSTG